MRRYDWIVVIVGLVFFFMIGLWIVDVSLSAILVGGEVTSGWWVRDPILSYHMGLILSLSSFVVLSAVAVRHVLRGE